MKKTFFFYLFLLLILEGCSGKVPGPDPRLHQVGRRYKLEMPVVRNTGDESLFRYSFIFENFEHADERVGRYPDLYAYRNHRAILLTAKQYDVGFIIDLGEGDCAPFKMIKKREKTEVTEVNFVSNHCYFLHSEISYCYSLDAYFHTGDHLVQLMGDKKFTRIRELEGLISADIEKEKLVFDDVELVSLQRIYSCWGRVDSWPLHKK